MTHKLMALFAALAMTRGLRAQATVVDASATQQMLLSATIPAIFSSSADAAAQVEAPKSAAIYYGRSPKKMLKPKTAKPDGGVRPVPARFDIMGAYTRWYPYSSVNQQKLFPLKYGGIVSGTYYKDRNIGLEVEGSYYEQTVNDGRKGGAAGPVYRFLVPFVQIRVHGLIGGEKFLGPIVPSNASGSFYANEPVWATVLTAGTSVDLTVPKTRGHFALRAQADYQYIHASYGPAFSFSGGQVNLNSYRLVPGLVFRFGHTADRPTGSQKNNRY